MKQPQTRSIISSIAVDKAEQLLEISVTLDKDHPLRRAIINRIACHSSNQLEEVEELERHLRYHHGMQLANKLLEKAIDCRKEIPEEELKPELVVYAFTYLAVTQDDRLENQDLLQDYLIPALEQIEKMPPMSSYEKDNAAKLARISLAYFEARDNLQVPLQLYYLAHVGGDAYLCTAYLNDRPKKNSMKEFLESLGYSDELVKVIKKCAGKLFYSSLFTDLLTLNQKDQLSICKLLSKLIIMEPPDKYPLLIL